LEIQSCGVYVPDEVFIISSQALAPYPFSSANINGIRNGNRKDPVLLIGKTIIYKLLDTLTDKSYLEKEEKKI
jgi:hypothetical protein